MPSSTTQYDAIVVGAGFAQDDRIERQEHGLH